MALKGVSGSITVTDNNGNQHTVDAEDLDFQEVERDSRQMGDEVMHSAEVQLTDDCSVTVEVWEYPEGTYNTHSISVSGGEHTDGDFSFDFEP